MAWQLRVVRITDIGDSLPHEGRGPKSALVEYTLGANFTIPPIGVMNLERHVWVEVAGIKGRSQQRLQLIVRLREFPSELHENTRLCAFVLRVLRG